ncbi:hypothetical protein LEMA_P055510.1 [Plenodomus lingam JN3]|uniref:Uncharacterized protein n=1 Tax=Leptosphaeria maculans (strain JN3 / isolate v23.1.3 / race Av1-4-5-6-7-8) TaxID=985895 RepID=E4ZMH6_LEPMJ|nr:hypothetical protein LEMA_P055510.1 [Plenodomus lingam JN3]CBX92845.1 hypothetical protein LEMA_P055510.1 [Plenodomus lingam JN3]
MSIETFDEIFPDSPPHLPVAAHHIPIYRMPPRIRIRPRALCAYTSHPTTTLHIPVSAIATYASVATSPASTSSHTFTASSPILRYPPTQPPSHKPPEVRKTQLHRQYQSLLKSSPLLLIFQHNNIKAVEWMSIRRELAHALQKLDVQRAKEGHNEPLGSEVKLQVLQTNIFASALRVVEFFHPEEEAQAAGQGKESHATDPRTNSSAHSPEPRFTHGLSTYAHQVASQKKRKLELDPLLSGPLAVVAFPVVAPAYLKTVLSLLAPSKPDFPAPSRKSAPDYYEPAVQTGLQKLMLLGARVEGKVFDVEGAKWVGGIPGGIDGLRAQLVHMLQGVGGSLVGALEGAGRSLYFTVEGRRMDLEDKEKGSGSVGQGEDGKA